MILRAIDEPKSEPTQARRPPRPIWEVLEEHQKALSGSAECWLITQPAHSALSGEIAAKLSPSAFGTFDEATIRAIALHDAGWSGFDSELVRASRADAKGSKVAISFLSVPPKEAIDAWTGSVETALKASPLGGLLVSEHFRTIAQMQAKGRPGVEKQMAAFVAQEDARQRKLRPKIRVDDAAMKRMLEGLRFCDLLSLYLSAGLTEPVTLPQQIQQVSMTAAPAGENTVSLKPSPFAGDEAFSFAALRHPRTKTVSSASFLYKVIG